MRRDALAIVQADGRLSPHEYLRAQVLHRLLSASQQHGARAQRHVAIADEGAAIAAVTQAVASLLPAGEGLRWAQAVLRSLGLSSPQQLSVPAVSELNQAIDRVALVGGMHRPALAKAWSGALPDDPVPQPFADALRCLCLVIDTPLPPQLAAQFDPLPALAEMREQDRIQSDAVIKPPAH